VDLVFSRFFVAASVFIGIFLCLIGKDMGTDVYSYDEGDILRVYSGYDLLEDLDRMQSLPPLSGSICPGIAL
jgi:hypothetical protein